MNSTSNHCADVSYMSQPHTNRQSTQLKFAWLVWGLAAAFYFFDYMARVAPGVMHYQLQNEFGLTEASFGLLTASFYVPYIIMQIPVGLLVDRFSVRRVLTLMSLITAFGCLVFSLANGLSVAALGRMLIGFSAAFAFISALRLATFWFLPASLGLLAGFTQALGMLGAAAGEAPVAYMVTKFGWRESLVCLALLFVVLSYLISHYVIDKPAETATKKVSSSKKLSIWQSLIIVLSSRQSWYNALYAGFLFAPTAVIGEALGPAYLQFGRGLSAHTAAFATGLIFIAWGIGGPVAGWLSDKLTVRKPLMIVSAACGVLLTTFFVNAPGLTSNEAYLIFFLYGFTNIGVAIAYALSTEIQPKIVVGTSIAFTNMVSILIGAIMQPIVGYLVDLSAGERAYHVQDLLLNDFRAGLNYLPVCTIIALLLVFFIKETHCQPVTTESLHVN